MSDYKSIIGKPLKLVSTNLDNAQAEGQIWYNSTTGEFKDVIISQAWSSAGAIITARSGQGASGNTTAGIIAGGRSPAISTSPPASPTPGNTVSNFTEEYDGTAWAAAGLMNQTRYRFGAQGTQTANLAAGGFVTPGATTANSEEYNGTSWTEGNNLGTSRGYIGGFGTQDAGLCFGGTTYPPNTARAEVEEYDGTSWTEVNNLPQTRYTSAVAGIQTAGIAAGGALDTTTPNSSPSAWSNTTVQYDGTNWTAGPNLNTTRNYSSGSGTQTSSLVFGGSTGAPSSVLTGVEEFDGTSYSNKPSGANLGTGRTEGGYGVVGPSASTAFLAGGVTTTAQSLTEEYNSSVNLVAHDAWASGGNMPGTGHGNQGDGTQDAAFSCGGTVDSTNSTFKYDGSSWTSSGNLGTHRYTFGANGTQTAGLAVGGFVPASSGGPANTANVEEFNGSSWSEQNNIPAATQQNTSVGTQTAALNFGGSPSNVTAEYDGTNWTSGGSLNSGRYAIAGFGTQTAAVAAGGDTGSIIALSEEYNGTAWSEGNDLSVARKDFSGAGIETAGMVYGGNVPANPSKTNATEQYNGTSYSNTAGLITSRRLFSRAGDGSSGLAAGGQTTTSVANTEEFSEGVTSLNVKTISTS